jgi:hypothetical protein
LRCTIYDLRAVEPGPAARKSYIVNRKSDGPFGPFTLEAAGD